MDRTLTKNDTDHISVPATAKNELKNPKSGNRLNSVAILKDLEIDDRGTDLI